MRRGVALGVAGTLLVVLGVLGTRAALQPGLTDADLAYCAQHAAVVADIWMRQGPPSEFDPRDQADNIAGYFLQDPGATIGLAGASYGGDFPGEQPPTDRIAGPLESACRALTHP